MSLNDLPERYEQFAALSDKVNLFWTLAPSSSPDGGDDDRDEIRFAVAYLLPRRTLLREHEEVTVVSRNRKNETLHDNADIIIHPHDDYDDGMDHYWLGFGLSSQGGMIGADMMIYLPPQHVPPSPDPTGSDTGNNGSNNITKGGRLLDAHGVAYSFPVLDECGQDWQLVNASIMSGSSNDDDQMNAWHVVEAKRLLR